MSQDLPNSGRIEGRTHVLPVRVYYEDTDFTGMVYHANYLRFFERGRSDFLRAAGIDHVALAGADTAITLTGINVKFRRPARIDDALVVRTVLAQAEGVRFRFAQTLHRKGEILAEAEAEACCIAMTGKPKRPPALLVDKLKPYLDARPSMF
jgi:acyl-CoA thioester hydrolase